MTAADFLRKLSQLKVSVHVVGNELRVRGPKKVLGNKAFLALLQTLKRELIEELRK